MTDRREDRPSPLNPQPDVVTMRGKITLNLDQLFLHASVVCVSCGVSADVHWKEIF